MEIHGKRNGGAGVKDETNYERGYRDGKRDVLEKIVAEIKQLPHQHIFGNVSNYSLLDVVVEIIGKYKAEGGSEE